MPGLRSLSTEKTVRATAKVAPAKWAALAPGKAKAKPAEHTSSMRKSSAHKRPRSASDSSDNEVVATFAKKKRSAPEIDEVVTEPEVVDAEEEDDDVVDLVEKGEDGDDDEEVSLTGFQLNVGTDTRHVTLI